MNKQSSRKTEHDLHDLIKFKFYNN